MSTEHSMDQSLNLYCIYITMVFIPFGPKCSPDWPTMRFLEYIFPSFEMELLIIRPKTDSDSANFFILMHISTGVD